MSGRWTLAIALMWLMGFARGVLRLLLAISGELEFREEFVLDWTGPMWPEYVDLSQAAAVPICFVVTVWLWRQIEWKD